MSKKVYSNIVKEVSRSKITETLDKYGSDGYKLVAVMPNDATYLSYLLFLTKEYIERD